MKLKNQILTRFKSISSLFLSAMIWLLSVQIIHAQEIDFGQYGEGVYTILVEKSFTDFVFEEPILAGPSGDGIYEIELEESLPYQLSIKGVKYLDIGIDIVANGFLYPDGDDTGCTDNPVCEVPFTLHAAYANVGEMNNTATGAKNFGIINTGASNTGFQRFPILERQTGPPGTPPPPPTGDFNQSAVQDTAVLYLYGHIDVSNIEVGGTYRGQIVIQIAYDAIFNN